MMASDCVAFVRHLEVTADSEPSFLYKPSHQTGEESQLTFMVQGLQAFQLHGQSQMKGQEGKRRVIVRKELTFQRANFCCSLMS